MKLSELKEAALEEGCSSPTLVCYGHTSVWSLKGKFQGKKSAVNRVLRRDDVKRVEDLSCRACTHVTNEHTVRGKSGRTEWILNRRECGTPRKVSIAKA